MSHRKYGPLLKILGRRLAAARDAASLTQIEAARRLGWPQSALSRMESGDQEVAAFELRDMARLYGASIEDLLADPTPEEEVAISEPRPEGTRHFKKT